MQVENRHHRSTLAFPFDPLRDDHAYFLGLLATDGTIRESDRNRGRISFELAERDAQLLAMLAKRIPYHATFQQRLRATNFRAEYRSTVLSFHDRRFREELAVLGYAAGPKALTAAPPIGPFDSTGFWRGVVDGDGSLGITSLGKPFVSLVTASEALRTGFVDLIRTLVEVAPNPMRNTRDGVFNITAWNEDAQEIVRALYLPGVIAIERKRVATGAILAWSRPDNWPRAYRAKRWSPDEDAVVLGEGTQHAIAERLGRTVQSVNLRRWRLRSRAA